MPEELNKLSDEEFVLHAVARIDWSEKWGSGTEVLTEALRRLEKASAEIRRLQKRVEELEKGGTDSTTNHAD